MRGHEDFAALLYIVYGAPIPCRVEAGHEVIGCKFLQSTV